jgi:hypothetical protein
LLASRAAAACECERDDDQADGAELPLIPFKSKCSLRWQRRRLLQRILIYVSGASSLPP